MVLNPLNIPSKKSNHQARTLPLVYKINGQAIKSQDVIVQQQSGVNKVGTMTKERWRVQQHIDTNRSKPIACLSSLRDDPYIPRYSPPVHFYFPLSPFSGTSLILIPRQSDPHVKYEYIPNHCRAMRRPNDVLVTKTTTMISRTAGTSPPTQCSTTIREYNTIAPCQG